MATHSSILALGNPMERGTWWATVHGVAKESITTQWLNNNNKDDLSYNSWLNKKQLEQQEISYHTKQEVWMSEGLKVG